MNFLLLYKNCAIIHCRTGIYLYNPGIIILIDHKVEPKELEADFLGVFYDVLCRRLEHCQRSVLVIQRLL